MTGPTTWHDVSDQQQQQRCWRRVGEFRADATEARQRGDLVRSAAGVGAVCGDCAGLGGHEHAGAIGQWAACGDCARDAAGQSFTITNTWVPTGRLAGVLRGRACSSVIVNLFRAEKVHNHRTALTAKALSWGFAFRP